MQFLSVLDLWNDPASLSENSMLSLDLIWTLLVSKTQKCVGSLLLLLRLLLSRFSTRPCSCVKVGFLDTSTVSPSILRISNRFRECLNQASFWNEKEQNIGYEVVLYCV